MKAIWSLSVWTGCDFEATIEGEQWLHSRTLKADCVSWGEAHGLSVCT